MKHIASCSFGKDSIATVLQAFEQASRKMRREMERGRKKVDPTYTR